jgi:pilus assembly protein Flp/PilA
MYTSVKDSPKNCHLMLRNTRFYLLLNSWYRKEVRHMLFLPEERGQGLVEYALILVLVAIVVIAILLLLGPIIGNVFSEVVNSL